MRILIACLLLAVSCGSYAKEDIHSGNSWYSSCAASSTSCLDFIFGLDTGFVYSAFLLIDTKHNVDARSYLGYCPSDNVNMQQRMDVFTKYLKDHPEERHLSAAFLALKSWGKAWPCKKADAKS